METDDEKRNDWLRYPPRSRRTAPKGWHRTKREILKNTPHCGHCGGRATEVDHVKPKCLGGSDDKHNLQPICAPCHRRKTAQEANHMRWHVHRVPYRKRRNSGV